MNKTKKRKTDYIDKAIRYAQLWAEIELPKLLEKGKKNLSQEREVG